MAKINVEDVGIKALTALKLVEEMMNVMHYGNFNELRISVTTPMNVMGIIIKDARRQIVGIGGGVYRGVL